MSERLPPLPPTEWPAEMRGALAALTPANPRHPVPGRRDDRPKALNMLGVLAHHPDLARAYHTLNGHVLFGTTLTIRQREILILRVGARRGAEYEWLQHKVIGLDNGMSEDEVEATRIGAEADLWSPFEAALVRAVDELVDEACIGDETYAVLSAELSPQQLLDVVFTVGAYDILAMALRSFDVVVDPDLASWK